MRASRNVDELYANDPPKFWKCVKYGICATLFWFVVAGLGYYVRDDQSPWYILTYALYWNILTLSLNVIDKLYAIAGCSSLGFSEDILHFATLLGGAPATVFALIVIKQKSKNPSYMETFFTWCRLSSIWMIFICFVVYSYQHIFNEFSKMYRSKSQII